MRGGNRDLEYGLETSVNAGVDWLSPLAAWRGPWAPLVVTLLWAGARGAKHPPCLSTKVPARPGSLTAGLVCSLDAALEAAVVGGGSHQPKLNRTLGKQGNKKKAGPDESSRLLFPKLKLPQDGWSAVVLLDDTSLFSPRKSKNCILKACLTSTDEVIQDALSAEPAGFLSKILSFHRLIVLARIRNRMFEASQGHLMNLTLI